MQAGIIQAKALYTTFKKTTDLKAPGQSQLLNISGRMTEIQARNLSQTVEKLRFTVHRVKRFYFE